MTDMYVMPEAEFEEIEDAVLQTPRGRAFLRQYAAQNRTIALDELQATVEAIKNVAADEQAESAHLDMLRRELQEMSAAIQHCRHEIASIKPEDGGNNRILAATEELDAIVTSTERATTDILSAAEVIQDVTDKLVEGGASTDLCDQVQSQAINIMTACSFQDITGQRTTKVVNALRYLEQRVNSMIEIWNAERDKQKADTPSPDLADSRPDSHLLNGPQLDGEGVNQDDVDALFANTAALLGDEPTVAEPNEKQDDEVAAPADDTGASDQNELVIADMAAPAADELGETTDASAEAADDTNEAADGSDNDAMSPTDDERPPDAADPETDEIVPTEENLVLKDAPLGQDEVAKLLGS